MSVLDWFGYGNARARIQTAVRKMQARGQAAEDRWVKANPLPPRRAVPRGQAERRAVPDEAFSSFDQVRPIARLHQDTMAQLGVATTITSTLRTHAKQTALYRKRGTSRYPAAAPGTSQHEFGAAYDLAATDPRQQRLVQRVGRELGMISPDNDPIHFQLFSAADWQRIRTG